ICVFVLVPAACRRVGLQLRRLISQAVWPAVWPVVPMLALLAVTRRVAGDGLAYVAAQSILAGAVYAAVFLLLAIGRDQRRWYESRVRQLLNRPRAAAVQEVSP